MKKPQLHQEELECKLHNILLAQHHCRCKAIKTTVMAATILAVASTMYTVYEPLTELFEKNLQKTAQTHLQYTALALGAGGLALWLYPALSRRCNRASEELLEEELATRAELYYTDEDDYRADEQPSPNDIGKLEYELGEIKKKKTEYEKKAMKISHMLASIFGVSFLLFTFNSDLALVFGYQDIPTLAASIKSASAALVFLFGILLLHNILYGNRDRKYESLLEAENKTRYRLAVAKQASPCVVQG